MPFPYKKVLLIGATSGLGRALAEQMLKNDIKVIVVGRRKENLDTMVSTYGADNCFSFVFDITKLVKNLSPVLPVFAQLNLARTPSLSSLTQY